MSIDFKKANRFLPHILLIGLGIGTANYIMNSQMNWVQWVILSLTTSLLIGYTLVVVAANKSEINSYFKASWQRYLLLFILFFLTGAFASEIECIVRSVVFSGNSYEPFTGGRIYIFNGIIAVVLGFSFLQNGALLKEKQIGAEPEVEPSEIRSSAKEELEDEAIVITKIPVKQGESIYLIPIEQVVYFEAFDNYAFLFNREGEKKLCDYSLAFLEQRLSGKFVRIHRKYIINTDHIKEIKPHLNGRYIIFFSTHALESITSSKSYTASIRKLIKID